MKVVCSIKFFTELLRGLAVFLTDFLRDHFFYELRFRFGRLIVKMRTAVITADFTFQPEAVRKGIVLAVQVQPYTVLIIDMKTEFLVHIEPCFDITGDFLPDITVHLHVTVDGDVRAFPFFVFFHAGSP